MDAHLVLALLGRDGRGQYALVAAVIRVDRRGSGAGAGASPVEGALLVRFDILARDTVARVPAVLPCDLAKENTKDRDRGGDDGGVGLGVDPNAQGCETI